MLMVVFLLTLLTAIHYRLVRSNKSHTTTAPSSKFPIWQTASNYAMYDINTITNQGNYNSKLKLIISSIYYAWFCRFHGTGNTVPGSRFNFQIIIGSWLLAAIGPGVKLLFRNGRFLSNCSQNDTYESDESLGDGTP
jgi:hypothetical protein